MKRTGERLRTSREEQKLTISEVSLSTKINPRVLQAMEDGNLEKLPAVSFLRGFIRTYAIYLKLDANELLELFTKELAEQRPPPPVTTEAAAPSPAAAPSATPEIPAKPRPAPPALRESSLASRSIVAGGVVLLIVIILGIKQIVDKYEREGSVDAPPADIGRLVHEGDGSTTPTPPDNSAAPSPDTKPMDTKAADTKSGEPEAAPTGESAPTPTAAPTEPVAAPAPSPKPPEAAKPIEASKPAEPPKPAEPAPTPTVVTPPTPPPPKPAEPVKPVEVAKPVEPVKADTPVPAAEVVKPKAGTPQELIIEALDQVEISFRIDGGRLETVVLKPEQVHTIKGTGSLVIDLSDGGAVNVIHNGIDKGVPGDLGKPKKIKFP